MTLSGGVGGVAVGGMLDAFRGRLKAATCALLAAAAIATLAFAAAVTPAQSAEGSTRDDDRDGGGGGGSVDDGSLLFGRAPSRALLFCAGVAGGFCFNTTARPRTRPPHRDTLHLASAPSPRPRCLASPLPPRPQSSPSCPCSLRTPLCLTLSGAPVLRDEPRDRVRVGLGGGSGGGFTPRKHLRPGAPPPPPH